MTVQESGLRILPQATSERQRNVLARMSQAEAETWVNERCITSSSPLSSRVFVFYHLFGCRMREDLLMVGFFLKP
jgi:hypothetical protein